MNRVAPGIRGWLLLPCIGLICAVVLFPIIWFAQLAVLVEPVRLFGPRPGPYHWFLQTIFLVYIGYIIYGTILFFRNKRSAPSVLVRLMFVEIIFSVLIIPVWGLAVWRVAIAVVVAIIFVPCFRDSDRVAVTFVN